MQIRQLKDSEFDRAQKLIVDVFNCAEAALYGEQGTKSFYEFLDYAFCIGRMFGAYSFYGAFAGKKLVGVSVHSEGHLYLLFVADGYRGQGIGKALVQACISLYGTVTVNAAPPAVGFYAACGFTQAGELKTEDGIQYIPMQYKNM